MSRMATSSFVIAALAATLAIGFVTGSGWLREKPGASARQTVDGPAAVSPPAVNPREETPSRSAARPADGDRALARILVEKMSALEARMDKLQSQSGSSGETARRSPPSLTPAEQNARNQQRIQRIDRALDNEPRDGTWSRETTKVLEELFTSVVPAGSTLADTTCGETFCRLVVMHQDHEARDGFEIFPRKVRGMGVRGLIEHRDDGSEQTTLYVVRKEYDSPEHPVRRQDQG